jgi:hypothetical protein
MEEKTIHLSRVALRAGKRDRTLAAATQQLLSLPSPATIGGIFLTRRPGSSREVAAGGGALRGW